MSVFTVEGNIGSGKTTLVAELQNLKFNKPHIVVFEQVKEWSELKDENGVDILSLFYKDKKKYSYIFQSYVLFSRLTHMLNTIKQNPNAIIITERCHLTDLYVFAKSLFELGDINSMEWEVYNMWHKQIRELFNLKIKGTIYISTNPEVCYNRIKKRNRNGEESIPLDYLSLLHTKHEDWLTVRPLQNEEVEWFSLNEDTVFPVLKLDGNVDIYDYEERNKQKKMIEKFINYHIKN
jgi:deoxyadenosine/deoxycytidine kinase